MNDHVIDSSVVVKWILNEADSARAQELFAEAQVRRARLVVLDLAFPEVANAIWKRHHQRRITADEARQYLAFLAQLSVVIEPAALLLRSAMDIALTYDRSIYDSLFVALSVHLNLPGVTADEPLYHALHRHFPNLVLLRSWQAGT